MDLAGEVIQAMTTFLKIEVRNYVVHPCGYKLGGNADIQVRFSFACQGVTNYGRFSNSNGRT